MSFSEVIKRELEVAFSKHSQPVVFRIAKYVILASLIWVFSGTNLLWIILGVLLLISLSLHFWYRHKTKGWIQSYGLWKHEKDREVSH